MEITYKNIVNFLTTQFPQFKETEEFKSFDEEDLKLPYIVTAAFARYSIDRLEKNGATDPELQTLFDFINDKFNHNDTDKELLNLISVEIFENFALTEKSLEYARSNTLNKARHAVEMTLVFCGVDKPDLTIAPEAELVMKNIENYNKQL